MSDHDSYSDWIKINYLTAMAKGIEAEPLPLRFLETRAVHMPIVPMSVRAPVVASMVYIEILLEK